MAQMKQESNQVSSETIQVLTTEKDSLDESFTNARRLLTEAIEKEQSGKKNGHSEDDLIDVVPPHPVRVCCRVRIPEKEYPKYNFVGKLLGPKGSTLKQLQEDTGTRMSILGRNSMRDKAKEEEQRKSGNAKYSHLHKDLHVLIEAFCLGPEAYSRVGHALTEMKKYLTPQDPNDDIRQNQMMEMGLGAPAPPRGAGGALTRGRTRGGPAARGMPRALTSVRGRPLPVSARGAARGGARGRGAPAARGRAAPRPLTYQMEEEYYDDGYGESYEEGGYDDTFAEGALDEGSYGYSDGGAGDGYQSYDYGGYGSTSSSGSYGGQASSSAGSYGGYSSGGSGWSSGGASSARQGMKAPTQYTQKPASRPHPYARY